MGPERIARFERGTKLRKLWLESAVTLENASNKIRMKKAPVPGGSAGFTVTILFLLDLSIATTHASVCLFPEQGW